MIYIRIELNEKVHGRKRIDYDDVSKVRYMGPDKEWVMVEGESLLSHNFPLESFLYITAEGSEHTATTKGALSIAAHKTPI